METVIEIVNTETLSSKREFQKKRERGRERGGERGSTRSVVLLSPPLLLFEKKKRYHKEMRLTTVKDSKRTIAS
jgi:hypothetical protein